mgnify:CR=1 FL=1
MKNKKLRSLLLMGGAALALAVVSTLAPDLILSGGNATVAQSGTAEDYFDVTCSAPVKSVLILGSYVRLHDCTVTGSTSHSIRVGNQYGNPNAALAHHVVIENNVVENAVLENGTFPNCGSGAWGSGIKAEKGSAFVTIRNNVVHDVCGEAIAVTMSPDATIENNLVYKSWAVAIYSDASPRTLIQNNSVTCEAQYVGGRESFAIASGYEQYPNWSAGRDGLRILNNTIQGCRDGISLWPHESGAVNPALTNAYVAGNTVTLGYRWSVIVASGVSPSNVVVENNRLFRTAYSASSGVIIRNNTIFNLPAITPTGGVFVTNSLTNTPASATNTATVVPATSTVIKTITPAPVTTTLTLTRTPTVIPSITPTRTPAPVTLTPVPVTGTPTALPTVCVPAYKVCLVPMP